MSDKRAARATEMMHAELARLVREEVKDPRIRTVSILHVQLSPDLRHVTAWVSPLGGQGDGRAVLRGLNSASGFLKFRLARLLRLRLAPELHFVLDDGLDESIRLTSLLGKLERERVVRPEEEVDPGTARAGGEE